MANVLWSDHALERMREQVRYIAAKSCSPEIAAKWANDIFAEAAVRRTSMLIDETTLDELNSVAG